MKLRILWILLILSLVFNLAFVAGAIFHRYLKPPFGPDTPPENQVGSQWRGKLVPLREQLTPYRQDAFTARNKFTESLRDQSVSEDSLRSLLNISIDKQMQLERQVGENLIQIRSTLPPQEAQKFFDRMHRKMMEHPPKDGPDFDRRH